MVNVREIGTLVHKDHNQKEALRIFDNQNSFADKHSPFTFHITYSVLTVLKVTVLPGLTKWFKVQYGKQVSQYCTTCTEDLAHVRNKTVLSEDVLLFGSRLTVIFQEMSPSQPQPGPTHPIQD